ncbi:uncharacterized protein DUF4350 [Pseudomonas duriflava]|uniref:Uncharacterized protein DUF4350 n=1 Tax=Pseudomonas duriflava TaxID=459528 RepID=A0A562QP47_9PSED|nr:DUF4350 domain-containing protein [Pseudomonas duriflava]TWI58532.1 uncharacterized protein DUF4350 [Pseudomonas duriflava]
MTRRAYALAAVLMLATLTALGLWGSRAITIEETLKDRGPSPEARHNPYLAAEHFLRRQHVDVQHSDSFHIIDTLPTAGHTVLILSDRQRMTPLQSQQALEWAHRGGHLVVVADRLWDDNLGKSGDPILDPLGIEQHLTKDLEPPDEATAKERWAHLTQLYLENEQAPAYIGFDDDYHLNDSQNRALAWANSAAATHMVQLAWGNGLITVLTDPWIWQNTQIDQYDNAWLLWYLTQDSHVTLLYRIDNDNLATLLVTYYPEALVALALLLVLALWHVALRQGPVLPAMPRDRRQLAEHLRASAEFIRRQAGFAPLIHLLQRDIQQRARRRHPGFERLAVAEQWQTLSRLTRRAPQEIIQAMRPLPPGRLKTADFIRHVARLQQIRRAL